MGNEASQPCRGKKIENNIKISWKNLTKCPFEPREGQCCTSVGSNLYIFGGVICLKVKNESGQEVLTTKETNQLLRYDVDDDIWEEIPTSGCRPDPRSGGCLSAVGDRLFMFGGLSENCGWLDDFWVFDIREKKWEKIEDATGKIPCPRDKLSSCVIRKSVFFFGGFGPDPKPADELDDIIEDDEDDAYEDVEIHEIEQEQQAAKFTWFGDLYEYNTETKMWSCISESGPLTPTPRAAHTMCAVGDSMVVFGGRDSIGRTNDVWRFSTMDKSWTELKPSGAIPESRSFHAAVSVGTRMVVLGGRSITNQHFQDFNILDLDSNQWLQPSLLGDVVPTGTGLHSLSVTGNHIILAFGASEMDPVTNSCTVYHRDAYAVSVSDVTSGGAVQTAEAEEGNKTESQSSLPGFLNLKPTTANSNGV